MTRLEYTFKTDTLFKMLFVKYPDLLKQLVAVLLGIKYDSIGQFIITNPEMPPESLGDKFCRLDINMVVDGQRVDLEIQVNDEGDYPERSLYYWAREFSTGLSEGEGYAELPRTIVINIIAFALFDCEAFHSEFQALEVTRHTPLTDKMNLHYYELPKLPDSLNPGSNKELWLKLFKAETEEELANIEALEVPMMNAAVQAYRHVSASPEFREIARLRSKARHDEAQALNNARRQGAAERDVHWQGIFDEQADVIDEQADVIDEQAGVIGEQAALIAELQAQLSKK